MNLISNRDLMSPMSVLSMPLEILTIEAHTGGEPFRIVIDGLPKMEGDTIVSRRRYMKEHHDDIRRALMLEPRGHPDMYGGYLTALVSPNSDLGIIFVHNEGYSDHCGHGTIALATIAVKLGWVERTEPETRVGIDAPCGFVEAFVKWDGKNVGAVRFLNVPSFLYVKDAVVTTPTFGDVTGDIAFGGAFYFYTDSTHLRIPIDLSQIETLKKLGLEVKTAANEKYLIVHPTIPEINHIYGTIIDGPSKAGFDQTNVCIFADRQVDRSPTGSGTAGRVAQKFFRGELDIGTKMTNESIVGSVFLGTVVKTVEFGGHAAVIPEIEGEAKYLGRATWEIDPSDILGSGFLVRD